MRITKFFKTVVAASLLLNSWAEARQRTQVQTVATRQGAANAGKVERPPQFIVMSFDGSLSIPFWKETRSFAEKHNIGFTYYISGVYLLSGEEKKLYQGPRKNPGRSDIGFGKSHEDIETRVGEIVGARRDGMEIGSHSNGHFDGSKWTLEEWRSEFDQFHKFVENVFSINPIDRKNKKDWDDLIPNSIRGFRAPLLGVNKDMYQSLAELGYQYDTSGIGDSKRWPTKRSDGMWSIPLQSVRLAGTGKLTVTMDYNILVAQCNNQFIDGSQSACKANSPEKIQEYEQETYETYVSLFMKNYYNNRAPLVIGHHFSLWNKGAYWRAMQRFAADVCNQEEVRCVTYEEMLSWMNQEVKVKSLNVIGSFEQGLFTKMPKKDLGLKLQHAASTFNFDASMAMLEQGVISSDILGRDTKLVSNDPNVTFEWQVDGETKKIGKGRPGRVKLDDADLQDGKVVTLSVKKNGKELLGANRTIRRNSDADSAWLQNTGWQERMLKGDLPEAHNEIVDEELLESLRLK